MKKMIEPNSPMQIKMYPKRFDFETFEEFKEREKESKQFVKDCKKGKIIYSKRTPYTNK
jgi:hypothetical protein